MPVACHRADAASLALRGITPMSVASLRHFPSARRSYCCSARRARNPRRRKPAARCRLLYQESGVAAVLPTGVVDDAVLILGERVSTPSSRHHGVEVARHTPSSRRRVAGASRDHARVRSPTRLEEASCGMNRTFGKPACRISHGGHVLDGAPQIRHRSGALAAPWSASRSGAAASVSRL